MDDALRWKAAQNRQDQYAFVPAEIWAKPEFQDWLTKMKAAGNELAGATFPWVFRVGNGKVFAWAMHAKMWIGSEQRHKDNEFVFGRPDVSCVVLWTPSEVVLIREFRSAGRTTDGMIHELPGGSSKHEQTPVETAVEEVKEETGLDITAERFKAHGFRQFAATLSTFGGHLFSVRLTEDEMAQARADTQAHGVFEDSERTFIEVVSLATLPAAPVDWSTVGMIMSVVQSK